MLSWRMMRFWYSASVSQNGGIESWSDIAFTVILCVLPGFEFIFFWVGIEPHYTLFLSPGPPDGEVLEA